MRKLIAAGTFTLVLGVAGAAGTDEQSPEGRAYFGASFGGERTAPRDFHYGLRLDHDSRFLDGQAAAPLMQMDFTTRGLSDARINGLSVLKKQYRMKQAEGETEGETADDEVQDDAAAEAEAPADDEASAEGEETAEAEEPGFFKGVWQGVTGFFGGIFGGDDDEAETDGADAATDTAEADAEAAPEEIAEGTFMGYNTVDWAMLAIGAVGIGFVASEVSNGDEDADPQPRPGGTTGGGCNPSTNPTGCSPTGGSPLAGFTPTGSGYMATIRLDADVRERMEWLDGGTGQMGDLQPRE